MHILLFEMIISDQNSLQKMKVDDSSFGWMTINVNGKKNRIYFGKKDVFKIQLQEIKSCSVEAQSPSPQII